ncbi:3-methyl-2-oxobutanoate hydroxymethyltransferase, putative [Eimeria acervulina]|uniref:3-methyl-2-oxobutanoate hydroxymethyltransferase n=1 Tax=Eimeria acervulina TaxID=5801 RepID=U6GXA5_EIMAC|nr:3-methyl-2-oxobutanoate hydroxymethyltransferase, putative [Eimeria acervulina]CDI83164.1 3-methyl-2-oxobutanoate hydroxymethyltransferase, putative [Eimeria acervulina]
MSSFYVTSGSDADDSTWGPGACTSLYQLQGMKRLTLAQILAKKRRQEKIVMCTEAQNLLTEFSMQAYDLFTSRVADDALVDIQLVGDSLANVVLDRCAGSRRSVVMFDLPYGTYNTPEEAVASTVKVVQETGIQLVKLEGHLPEIVREVQKHAAVCCHIGVLPQTATTFASTGGTAEEAERLLQQALDLQNAGASLIVLEMRELFSGIGCDGQVLVIHDMLGLSGPGTKTFKFAKRYVNLYDAAVSAVETYRAEVMAGSFPQACNSSFMKPAESEKLLARCSGRAVTRDTLKVFPSGNGITSSHPHGTTMEGSVPVGTSSDCAEPVQAGPYKSTSSPRSDDADNGAKRSFILTNETVRTGCHPKGAEERRPVDVVSRKAMETLGRTFDLVIIACLSGDTQDIGVSCEIVPHQRLDEVLWEKAAVNCCINPLAALLNCTNGQLVDPRMDLARKLVISEVVAVARGKGIPLTFASACASAITVARASMDNISSTLGQLRQGRQVELVDISGEVIREANAIGLKAPVNRLLLELVGVLEATRARRLPIQQQFWGS